MSVAPRAGPQALIVQRPSPGGTNQDRGVRILSVPSEGLPSATGRPDAPSLPSVPAPPAPEGGRMTEPATGTQ